MTNRDPRPEHRVGDTLRRSWGMFASRFGALFLGFFVMTLIINIASGVTFGLAAIVITGPFWLGLCTMALAAVRNDEVRVGDVFSGFNQFLQALGLWFLIFVFALVGTLLFLLPAIILGVVSVTNNLWPLFVIVVSIGGTLCMAPGCVVAVLYAPAFFFVSDQDLGIWDAMEASRKMVANNLGRWVSLWLGLSAVGILVVFLGLLLALGVVMLLTWTMGLLAGMLIGVMLAVILIGLPSFLVTPWMLVALALAYEREQSALAPILPAQAMPPPLGGAEPPPLGSPQAPMR